MSAEVFLAFEVAHTQTLRPLEYIQAKQKPRQEAASAPHGPSSSVGRELWSTRGQGHSKVLPAFLLPASLCPWEVFLGPTSMKNSIYFSPFSLREGRYAGSSLLKVIWIVMGPLCPHFSPLSPFLGRLVPPTPSRSACCENPGLQADI